MSHLRKLSLQQGLDLRLHLMFNTYISLARLETGDAMTYIIRDGEGDQLRSYLMIQCAHHLDGCGSHSCGLVLHLLLTEGTDELNGESGCVEGAGLGLGLGRREGCAP